MDYYRDYLGRLIITEELGSSVLNKLKRIAGVSGNVKVVLSKEAEKEINTIKNASMNGASRGLIVAALVNDTNKSISSNIRKYGFNIGSEINEDLNSKTVTERILYIDYNANALNHGLHAEGLIFESLCVNHFDDGKKIICTLNDILGGAKNSLADIDINYNGEKAAI